MIEIEPSKNAFIFFSFFACFVDETLLQEEDERDEALNFEVTLGKPCNLTHYEEQLFPYVRTFKLLTLIKINVNYMNSYLSLFSIFQELSLKKWTRR